MTKQEIRGRLRLWRTLFVHRWHAAVTVGERLGNPEVGERFEHLNHARSLAQYVWLHGAFRENEAGDGREPVESDSLRDVEDALAAGEPDTAKRLGDLARAMGAFYGQMRLRAGETNEGQAASMEWSFAPERSPFVRGSGMDLRGLFAVDVRAALACRARAELFETLAAHPLGREYAEPSNSGRYVAMVGGVRTRWDVLDPALAAMLDSIDEPPLPRLVQVLAGVKTFVSACITTTPVFVVKNFFRDTLAGFVAGRYWQAPFVGTLTGAVEAARELATGDSDAMRDYLLQGGFYSGLVEAETDVDPATRGSSIVLRRRAAKVVHWLTRPAWLAEAGTRVDQFRAAKRAGASDYAASRAARMVSSDFANVGASRGWRCYVHMVPFLNAALQGLDQLYQIGRRPVGGWTADQQAHMRKTALAGLCVAGASFGAWVWNTSDPARRAQYEAETEYEKAAWATLYDVSGKADVRLPVPFQIGATFMKLPELAFDVLGGANTLAGPRFAWELVHSNLWLGWKPAVIGPAIEVYANRNFFGEKIVPGYMEDMRPERQYFRTTLLPYRRAGELLGASPLMVQTVWRGYTGHVGDFAANALHELMWDESADGPLPFPRALRLATGIHTLSPPKPRTRSRWTEEFYRLARDTETGTMERSAANTARRRASEFRREIDDATTDAQLTRAKKREYIMAAYADIENALATTIPFMAGDSTRQSWVSTVQRSTVGRTPGRPSNGRQLGRPAGGRRVGRKIGRVLEGSSGRLANDAHARRPERLRDGGRRVLRRLRMVPPRAVGRGLGRQVLRANDCARARPQLRPYTSTGRSEEPDGPGGRLGADGRAVRRGGGASVAARRLEQAVRPMSVAHHEGTPFPWSFGGDGKPNVWGAWTVNPDTSPAPLGDVGLPGSRGKAY